MSDENWPLIAYGLFPDDPEGSAAFTALSPEERRRVMIAAEKLGPPCPTCNNEGVVYAVDGRLLGPCDCARGAARRQEVRLMMQEDDYQE